jgi:anti-sigma factor RsiW
VTAAGKHDPHLTPEQTAGYLDEVLTDQERAVVEAHMATCYECRDEVVALRPVVKARSPRRWLLRIGIPVGAAAAAALVLLIQPGLVSRPEPSLHRDPPQDVAPGPVPRTPAGLGSRPLLLAWSPLDEASRYRVLVFNAEGSILFRAEVGDSVLGLPDSVVLSPGQPYFWKVEADKGWDRWVSSRLVEFSVRTAGQAEP